MKLAKLTRLFADPPAEYRSMPLWVWNGEMTEQRITEMLEQFAARGIGGVFVHPRPGLITEYLSDRWFELWKFALRECKRLGLICNVYDENSYPAGFAGGHVPARVPQATVHVLSGKLHSAAPVWHEGELLSAYRMTEPHCAELLPAGTDLNEVLKEHPVFTVELRRATGNPWTGGFPYMDLTHPEVAREFIATTYEPYRKHFKKELGKTIRAFFCDEPLLGYVVTGSWIVGLPCSYYILSEFRKLHDYDLRTRLVDLFLETEQAAATRFDYFSTIQRLWERNFLSPLYEWCSSNGVQFTGHYMEHEWPNPFFHPNSMHAYKFMHIPGIDLLAPQFSFQDPSKASLCLMTVREAASVVHQLGKDGLMCETHGVGGHEATLEDFKRLSDWLMVHGVDNVVQHLSFETICGARKHDHPQTYSDHSPWWDDYKVHADHVARLSVLLRQGKRISRVLVLQPTTTGWINGSPLSHEKREHLRETQAELVQFLCDHQIDFDLGDELIMGESGTVVGDKLAVGTGEYSLVIIPTGMDNWCSSTIGLLSRYMNSGGMVLSLALPPKFIDGQRNAAPDWTGVKPMQSNWIFFDSLPALVGAIRERLDPLIADSDGKPLPLLIAHQARLLEGGDVLHLLVNSGHTAWSGAVRVAGTNAAAFDTAVGRLESLDCRRSGSRLSTEVELPSAGHFAFIASGRKLPATTPQRALTIEGLDDAVSLSFSGTTRSAENVLALDFCDLAVAFQEFPGQYVTRANREVWRAHGFERDPWDRAIQYRRQHIDRHFDDASGFAAVYRFVVNPAEFETVRAAGTLRLAVERPELYRISLNGVELEFSGGERWLDEVMRAVSINHVVKPGENEVRISIKPFHPLCEIDRIYIIGNFATYPAERGFEITAARDVALGDWTRQGLSMYAGAVRYEFSFPLERAGRVSVRLPEWKGSVVRVFIDGRDEGRIWHPPFELTTSEPLIEGMHSLEIEVVGTLKNLLGPHFCKAPFEGRWNTPGAWDDAPDKPAAGADYEILPYGLMFLPEVKVSLA